MHGDQSSRGGGFGWAYMNKDKHLSTTTVARMLGVAVGSVANWIDNNKLKAGRTPGGHRRVTKADLLSFVRRHNLPVPDELVGARPRILIVDDEPDITKWIAKIVQEHHPDYEVKEAHEGFGAGEIVGSWQPNVVLLDLRMPDLDGFAVCSRIKSRPDGKNVVVIAITGDDTPQAKSRIIECGAVAYLTKPLDTNQLMVKINQAVSKLR